MKSKLFTFQGVTWIIIVFSILLVGLILVLSPPIEGYYDSPNMSYLNGSTGHVLLDDGEVYMINIDGESGPSNERIGSYARTASGAALFHFTDTELGKFLAPSPIRFSTRGFAWEDHGSKSSYNRRIFSPTKIHRLKAIPKGTPPR